MDIWTIASIVFFGAIFYFLFFKAPPSDRVFTAESDAEVFHVKNHLEANGIKTYIKSRSMRRYHPYGALVNPSLHVLRIEDKKRALQLIKDLRTGIDR